MTTTVETARALEAELLDVFARYTGTLGDPRRSGLEFDPQVRITENGQVVGLDDGLRRTITHGLTEPAITVADVTASAVAGWGLVRDAGAEFLLGTRLTVDAADRIAEIEHLALRRPPMGAPAFAEHLRRRLTFGRLPGDDVPARGSLVAAAHGYFDGVAGNDPQLIPAAPECLRFEDGLQTVLNPDREGIPASFPAGPLFGASVTDQIATGSFQYIEAIRDRTPLAIDERRGLVLMRVFFDHPGQLRGSGYRSPIASPNSMLIWELFRVEGGQIRHVEAIHAPFPYGMQAGWPAQETRR